MVILTSDKNSALCNLLSQWTCEAERLVELSTSVTKHSVSAAMPNVVLYHSETPSSGKSLSIIKDLVIKKRNASRIGTKPYVSLPVDGKLDEFVTLLQSVDSCRATQPKVEAVCHLSIAHTLDTEALGVLLFKYVQSRHFCAIYTTFSLDHLQKISTFN